MTDLAGHRLRAAYRLAGTILAGRHDRELRELAMRLFDGEEVDGMRLDSYLRRLAGHRRPRAAGR